MTMQRRNRQRGKAHERATAKALGGKRIGILGSEDVQHSIYSIECKSVKAFVGRSWYEQCVRNNKDGKINLVVIHLTKRDHDNDYVLLKLSDLLLLTKDKELTDGKCDCSSPTLL